NVEVPQPDPSADAIRPVHSDPLSQKATGMPDNRASRLGPGRAGSQPSSEATGVSPTTQSSISRRRTAMWTTRIAQAVMPLGLAIAAPAAMAQDTVKVGMVMPLTGTLADAGKQVLAGARLYMSQHGDTVAGKRIELVVKDDTSSFE